MSHKTISRTYFICDLCGNEIDKDLMWYRVFNHKWHRVAYEAQLSPVKEREFHLCMDCGRDVLRMLSALEIEHSIPDAKKIDLANKEFIIVV